MMVLIRKVARTIALFLVALVACSGNHRPTTEPTNLHVAILQRDVAWIRDTIPVVRFDTPYIYGQWRLEVEACSGRTRDGWPKFYIAPISPLTPQGQIAFYSPGETVVFALGYEDIAWVVRHELLHWLIESLIPPGADDETPAEKTVRVHPAEYFQQKCGPLVNAP